MLRCNDSLSATSLRKIINLFKNVYIDTKVLQVWSILTILHIVFVVLGQHPNINKDNPASLRMRCPQHPLPAAIQSQASFFRKAPMGLK